MSTAPTPPTRRQRALVWHPLLFAAYPVLFLWSQNTGEASGRDVLPVLAVVVGAAALLLLLVALPFRDARRAALLVTPLVVGLLMYGHVANLLDDLVRPLIQQAGWAALCVLGLIAAIRLREPGLRRMTRALDGIAAVLVLVTLVTIIPAQASAVAAPAASTPGPVVARSSDRPLRDVYYVVLDRYGSDASLAARFGTRNDLAPWLAERGFRVLPDSHANYVKTVLSMASTLNMTHLQDLAARVGPDSADLAPVFAMLQDPSVPRQFKALGYEYVHVGSFYQPTQTDVAADRNLYPGGPSDFAAAFFDATAGPLLARRLGLSRHRPIHDRFYQAGRYAWDALASLRDEPGPKFVLAHVLLPHPPYLFTRDGQFRDPEDAAGLSEQQRFEDQLGWTNDRLKAWLTSLLELPEDRRPIVILQADEGPLPVRYQRDEEGFDWATATPEELVAKYGILNAWYLPDGSDPGLDDAMTSVNTFPVLFSGYFGIDVPRLADRSFTSAGKHRPYDFTDITDRLAAAASPAP